MNKFLFSIMIAIVGFLTPALAQDVQTTDVSSLSAALYSEEMTVEPGGQIVLPIYMKNSEPVTLFQTNVYVPEGFSFVKKTNGKYTVSLVRGRLTDEDDNHVISSNVQSDGSLLILCASQDNYTFDGNDGKVATVTISVADNVKGGQYVIKLNNQKLVRPDNMGDNIAEYQVVITVSGGDEAEEAAENFRTDNATILGKTTSTIKSSDIDAINAALEAYNLLSDEAQAKLTTEKALLDSLKSKAEELKAAEEADAAAAAEANKFKTDNANILGKTTSTVASSDIAAINKALEDYSKLSDAAKAKLANGEKTLLDGLKTKAEELKAAEEADAAAAAEASKFKTDNATILAKTTSTVKSSDLTAINKALDDYSKLSDAAKAKLTNGEKSKLDGLKSKAEELKAAEEADAAATAEANKFKTDNANILGKTTSTVKSSDLAAINKALDDYSKLSEAAKNKLANGEKTLLDALKTKAEELKAAEEADAAAAAEASKFKTDNANILGKTTSTVASSDIAAITKALDDYSKLSDAAQAKLTNGEKALLDSLKSKAEELKAAEEADAAAAAEANKFKTDNANILGKTTSTVKSSDLAAINKALDDYSKLSDAAKAKLTNGEKAKLDGLKTKAEELKAAEEADAAAAAEASKFKTDNANIFAKTTSTVKSSDLAAINKALDDYSKLSDAAKAKLTNGEKALLDALKIKAEELKAAEEADAAAAAEASKFKTDNANILGKTTSTVKSSDLAAINKALDDYSKLSDAAEAKLTNGEKALLDSLKTKAEELKAAEEADAAATAEANKFKTDNAAILGKNVDNITAADKDAIDKALQDYNALSQAAKDKLTAEKADLDGKKEKVEAIITSISSINAYTSVDKFYNLNGQRASSSAKGIIIINGKKLFVR